MKIPAVLTQVRDNRNVPGRLPPGQGDKEDIACQLGRLSLQNKFSTILGSLYHRGVEEV